MHGRFPSPSPSFSLRRRGPLWAALFVTTLLFLPAPPALIAASATLPPPLPPPRTSPVADFRHLLSLPPSERAAELALRSEAQQSFLLQRLAEYEQLPEHRREERLLATDLYWHLQQLLSRSPTERQAILDQAPPTLQPVLIARLHAWDSLSPEDRSSLLRDNRALRYLARWNHRPPPPLPGDATTHYPPLPPTPTPQPPQSPASAATTSTTSWNQLLENPSPGTQRALERLDTPERQKLQEILDRYQELPRENRQKWIESFQRFTHLPDSERAAFLHQAQVWKSLPPEERQAWRDLSPRLPPLPPVPLPTQRQVPPVPPLPNTQP